MQNLIPVKSLLFTGLLVAPLSLVAQESSTPSPGPQIGWFIRYDAMALPGTTDPKTFKPVTWPIKTTAGTTLESYDLSFDASGLFVAEGDGKIAFTQEGTFQHQANWKADDGKSNDYVFHSRGTIVGQGEIDASHLKLKLDWKSGTGRGKSSGRPIASPVADHANSSEWDLKPGKIRVRYGSADWQEVDGFSGSQSHMMSQHLAGCDPLSLVEQIEIYQAPTADLEVTAKADPEAGALGGKCALTVSIKNLGPDSCPPCELNVSLPQGILVTLPEDAETVKGGYTTLQFPLVDLAKDGVATVKVEYVQSGELPAGQKEITVTAVANVTTRAFDPNPVNNGHIELTKFSGDIPPAAVPVGEARVESMPTAQAKPLTEKDLSLLLKLKITPAAIVSKVQAAGVAEELDEAAIERLQQAGASDAVLAALRDAMAKKTKPVTSPALTYEDVLRLLSLGVDEPAILRRHAKSPAPLTLDADQMAKLKQAGASDMLLATLTDVGHSSNPNESTFPVDRSVKGEKQVIDGWGTIVDSAGDSTIRNADHTLIIILPDKYRDLWPIQGEVNAPLVLQDIEGDFTVEVLVADVTRAAPNSVLPGMASTSSFHAGSLVIWQDEKNFIRFDRTDMHKDGRASNACYLHVFHDGERTASLAPTVPDRPTHLRLTRKGNLVTASYSQDGAKTWTSLPEQIVRLADKVQTGVSALNNTNHENVVRFENLKLGK